MLRLECPWDRAQTHASLRRHLLEETYETLDALDRIADGQQAGPVGGSAVGAWAVEDLREELGDLLFQVVFHAHLAAESHAFDLADVIDGVRVKLVGRHPNIFPSSGDATAVGPDVVIQDLDWERAKVAEKGRSSVMDGIPEALPALARAAKVVAKVDAVMPETAAELPSDSPVVDETDLGRRLFALVVTGRRGGLDPEAALRRHTRRVEARVRSAE